MSRKLVQESAPGKAILFGEHAVVYGRPAIAVPVTQVKATATIQSAQRDVGLTIVAADLGERIALKPAQEAPSSHPLVAAVRLTLTHLQSAMPDARLTIRSTIPIASGLGSGAAVSTALIRALAAFLDRPLSAAEVNALVFEVEKIHHGTPSGIDNTVTVYEQPIYFVKGDAAKGARPDDGLGKGDLTGGELAKADHCLERLSVGAPFMVLVADTGVRSSTREVVAQVRRAWRREQPRYEALFDQIGEVAEAAREAIRVGDLNRLGVLMDENHDLLVDLGVSSPSLETLVNEAHFAGALGVKLSGAGQGGNVIALVDEETVTGVERALQDGGAKRVIRSTVR